MSAKDTNKQIDWESIEKDWRAGIKTKLQMSEEHAVSRAAMDKRFKKLGIERDLTEKIQQRAQALVTQAVVTQQVTSERLVTTEKEIVEANAGMQASAVLGQRRDIARSRQLAMSLLAELEETTDNRDLFKQLGEILAGGDDESAAKMGDIYRKVTSMPMRIDSMKKLAETLKVLIALEREAFGIDAGKDSATDAVEALRKLANGE